jgi:hypothetical protein
MVVAALRLEETWHHPYGEAWWWQHHVWSKPGTIPTVKQNLDENLLQSAQDVRLG